MHSLNRRVLIVQQKGLLQSALYPIKPRMSMYQTLRAHSSRRSDTTETVPNKNAIISQHSPIQFSTRSTTTTLQASTSTTLFLTIDINSPISLHLLAPIDSSTHSWVLHHVSPDFQQHVAGQILSNTPIILSLCGWALCFTSLSLLPFIQHQYQQQQLSREESSTHASTTSYNNNNILTALSITAATFFLTANPLSHGGDNPLVDTLKHLFQRQRPPSPLFHHHTYSFPSGHTVNATIVSGILLTILLPLTYCHM